MLKLKNPKQQTNRSEYYASYYQAHKNTDRYKEKRRRAYKRFIERHPWYKFFYHIKRRCEYKQRRDYSQYGAKGIKLKITPKELMHLWFRDEAHLLKQPSIDRKDSSGHYTYINCRFVELPINLARGKA